VSSPLSVREIANELPVTRQAVARHLSFLAAAGLVAGCEVDSRRAWQLNEQGLGSVRNYLEILERG
jgi:predicted ArsR family transcriptional regulator